MRKHVVWDFDPFGYTIWVMEGAVIIDEYSAGNSRLESTEVRSLTDRFVLPLDEIEKMAKEEAERFAEEHGVPANLVGRDKDIRQ